MTILANARLVLAQDVIHGSLEITQGRITAISEGPCHVAGAIDCEGDLIIPGLVELHTDNLERHLEPRPSVNWPHRAAMMAHDAELASVGITTVFDALRVGSVVKADKTGYGEYARGIADEILALSQQNALRINHLIHLRAEVCSETLTQELAKFGPDDHVGIISLMDHTPGQRQFRDIGKLREYVMGKRGMSEQEFQAHVADQQALHARYGAIHEAAVVTETARIGAVLASHDDTTADQVALSKSYGVQFAEFPTTYEAAQACRDLGIAVMMGAPNLIRGGSHSGNVAASALAQADLLDILSSDYVPASLINGALILADLWGDLARGIACVTKAPAQATGLHDRGELAIGLRADLVRVNTRFQSAALRGVWVDGRQVS